MIKVGDRVVLIGEPPVSMGVRDGVLMEGDTGLIVANENGAMPIVKFEDGQGVFNVFADLLRKLEPIPVVPDPEPWVAAPGTVARTIREVQFDAFHFGIASLPFAVPICIAVEIIRELPNDRVECYVESIPFLIVFKRSDLEIVG